MGLIKRIIRCFCYCEVADDELYVGPNFQNHNHLVANRNTSANDYQPYLSNIQKSGKYKSGTSDALQQNGTSSQSSFQESGKHYSGTSDALQQNRTSTQSSFQESGKHYSGTSDALQQNGMSRQSRFFHHEDCNTQTIPATLLSRSSSNSSIDTDFSVVENVVVEERWIKWYSSRQRILLVGDGNFSFSASLAKAFVSAPNMIATSLDSREFLRQNYPQALSNIQDLERRGCRVIHGIDCTKMSKNGLLEDMTFDRVVFNFPFAGFFKNKTRHDELRLHQELVSKFMENAKKMICKKGEIHITHKSNGFLRDWNLENLALLQGLKLIEAVNFNHNEYPGYRTKYGFGGDRNFNCYPSKTYKFCLGNC